MTMIPVPTVRVIAPATLDAGYTFEASVDDKIFTITVPEGGVKEGQEFEVPYPDEEQNHYDNSEEASSNYENDEENTSTIHNYNQQDDEEAQQQRQKMRRKSGQQQQQIEDEIEIPRGKWRTGLLSCCDVVTQSTFWMGCACPAILLAQVMTRLKLNWRGEKGSEDDAAMTFNTIVGALVVTLLLLLLPVVGALSLFVFFLFVVYIGSKTRYYLRKTYDIKTPNYGCSMYDGRINDVCSMIWCTPCTSIQMARHTHDDKEYPGYCCTTTGLEPSAPEIKVLPDSSDVSSDIEEASTEESEE